VGNAVGVGVTSVVMESNETGAPDESASTETLNVWDCRMALIPSPVIVMWGV
jgi:hypothetical protein